MCWGFGFLIFTPSIPGHPDNDLAANMWMFGLFLAGVGVVLAFIGAFVDAGKNQTFTWIGATFNSLVVLAFFVLLINGKLSKLEQERKTRRTYNSSAPIAQPFVSVGDGQRTLLEAVMY